MLNNQNNSMDSAVLVALYLMNGGRVTHCQPMRRRHYGRWSR